MIAIASHEAPRPEIANDADARLMMRVRAGDSDAFCELTARHRAQVARLITHRMRHDRQTEDLSQEVFLRIFRARHRYVIRARFSTWLFTIVRNVVSNAQRDLARRERASRRRAASDEMSQAAADSPTSAETPLDETVRDETRLMVRTALELLHGRQRTAVRLFYFQGLSYSATAAAMGTSLEAIRSLLTRARTRIRALLTPYIQGCDEKVEKAS